MNRAKSSIKIPYFPFSSVLTRDNVTFASGWMLTPFSAFRADRRLSTWTSVPGPKRAPLRPFPTVTQSFRIIVIYAPVIRWWTIALTEQLGGIALVNSSVRAHRLNLGSCPLPLTVQQSRTRRAYSLPTNSCWSRRRRSVRCLMTSRQGNASREVPVTHPCSLGASTAAAIKLPGSAR